MAAAWDLTNTGPDAGHHPPCDVTVFQMGGRLGGKGASSRNPAKGERIEEHGLHLWLGYYENAFRMIRTCFEELRGVDVGALDRELKEHLDVRPRPFRNWDWLSAFERASIVGLADDSSGDWTPWIARFPEYVLESEARRAGPFEFADTTGGPETYRLPGFQIVGPGKRWKAHPGEPDDGNGSSKEKEEASRPDAAFFLSRMLHELQAFARSLELRAEELHFEETGAPPPLDPDEVLSQTLHLEPLTNPDEMDVITGDVARALRLLRVALLTPVIQTLAHVARLVEGPIEHARTVTPVGLCGPVAGDGDGQGGDADDGAAYDVFGLPGDGTIPGVDELADSDGRDRLVALLDTYIDRMREKVETFVWGDTTARRTWELIDLIAAHVRGIMVAGLEQTDDFSSLDEYNYEDWLRLNRIGEQTLQNPIIRGAHDLGFAYRDGNPNDPQIAAGQAINAACRFFFLYKGALFWRMTAGMGDVVFAPMYLALRCRGVKFRFFHRLDDIELDPARERVTRLTFWQQVRLKDTGSAATNYEPLRRLEHEGGGMSVWRHTPDTQQFDYTKDILAEYEAARGGADKTTYVEFESIWSNWTHGAAAYATVGEAPPCDPDADPSCLGHFDDVVVTVPIAALGRVSSDLRRADNEAGARWRAMLDNHADATVATQAMQLWVNRYTQDLGWTHGQVAYSAFVTPFDTWADLSQLVQVEQQPDARGVHYFCCVLPGEYVPPDDADPARIVARLGIVRDVVLGNARRFLTNWIFHLWPRAVHRYPNLFRWEVLVAPEISGPERLEYQHVVANVDPSDRYTLTLPGTTKYRIAPDGTGFDHLYIAGDWTDCGLNIGCVEAAVIAGRLASHGIRGYPEKHVIPNFRRLDDQVWAEFRLE